MTRPTSRAAWAILVSLAVLPAAYSSAADGGVPTKPPAATRPATAAAAATDLRAVITSSLGQVLGGAPLTFSTGDAAVDGPRQFELMLTFVVPLKGGGSAATNYVVARDGPEIAVLVLGADGTPYAYATRDLLIGPDPAAPGEFLRYDRGGPVVALGINPASGNFAVEVGFKGAADAGSVHVEVGPVLRAALAHLDGAAFDVGRGVVKLETRNTTVGVFLPARAADGGGAADDLPLRGVVVKSRGGVAAAASNFRTGVRSSILGRRAADFERLGLPTRAADAGTPKVPLFVPVGFGRDQRERRAADHLRTVFPDVRLEPAVTPESPLEGDPAEKA